MSYAAPGTQLGAECEIGVCQQTPAGKSIKLFSTPDENAAANGLLTERTRLWHFDVRPGPTGLMEIARAIRPDEVSLT